MDRRLQLVLFLAAGGVGGVLLFALLINVSMWLFGANWDDEGRVFAVMMGLIFGSAGIGFAAFVWEEMS